MKIKSLHIADFNQFQDFSLDLTYPAGHEKAGEPLDKVCIIGQSGTGKTSLLNLITLKFVDGKINLLRKDLNDYNDIYNSDKRRSDSSGPNVVGLSFRRSTYLQYIDHFYDFVQVLIDRQLQVDGDFTSSDHNFITYEIVNKEYNNYTFPRLYYFTTKLISENPKNPLLPNENGSHNSVGLKMFGQNINTKPYWSNIEYGVKAYQEEIIRRKLDISEIKNFEKFEKKQKEYDEWVLANENPLKMLGEGFLDRILTSFNLKVKQDLDFKSKESIGELVLETLQGAEIPRRAWSTGTNQIINTALPLYADKPEGFVILLDEPERSLYPDIQTKIVDFYTSLALDSQFFFATHSPLVASCFDPWEIVELKFKEDGTVYQEQYYEGARHVDNYNVYPKRLNFSGILSEVFDVQEESNPERIRVLMELSLLEQKIKETPLQSEKKVLWEKYEKLAETLNWETSDAEN